MTHTYLELKKKLNHLCNTYKGSVLSHSGTPHALTCHLCWTSQTNHTRHRTWGNPGVSTPAARPSQVREYVPACLTSFHYSHITHSQTCDRSKLPGYSLPFGVSRSNRQYNGSCPMSHQLFLKFNHWLNHKSSLLWLCVENTQKKCWMYFWWRLLGSLRKKMHFAVHFEQLMQDALDLNV